jgi:hypothetical protein
LGAKFRYRVTLAWAKNMPALTAAPERDERRVLIEFFCGEDS